MLHTRQSCTKHGFFFFQFCKFSSSLNTVKKSSFKNKKEKNGFTPLYQNNVKKQKVGLKKNGGQQNANKHKHINLGTKQHNNKKFRKAKIMPVQKHTFMGQKYRHILTYTLKKRKKSRFRKFFHRPRESFKYVKYLKNLVLKKGNKHKLKLRFLYKLILVTKQAFLQYFRKFSLKNFYKLYLIYRKKLQYTKFEKFVMFFEFRLPILMMRIRYARHILYANFLIHKGQVRVNGHVILFSDFQTRLGDVIEIAYRAFYRQYFKMFMNRKAYKFLKKSYGKVYFNRRYYIFFLLKKVFARLPKWLFFGFVRAFRSAFAYAVKKPNNDYMVQSKLVLATIIFTIPLNFIHRRFTKFLTKKHLKFFSNFCTTYA